MKKGDLVVLKSNSKNYYEKYDGPVMIVEKIDNDLVACVYWINDHYERSDFDISSLALHS